MPSTIKRAILMLALAGCHHSSSTASDGGVVDMAPLCTSAGACPTDWLQFNFDAQHSGFNPYENTISAANVASLTVKARVTLPAIVDGAPAFLRGSAATGMRDLLFVTTKDGTTYALDAGTLATVWMRQPATGPRYTTSSPAIDPSKLFVYGYGLEGRVHKWAVGDGSETIGGGWPAVATIKPTVEKGSSALGWAVTPHGSYLYVANGGYPGDAGDYQGHVTAVDLSTGAEHVFNADCSDVPDMHFAIAPATPSCAAVQTAVWARAGAVYHAGLDRILFATGNGDFDVNSGGHDWGDSVLAVRSDGSSVNGLPVDSFTPTDFAALQAADADLGSTAPAILPTPKGSRYPHLAVQSGKRPTGATPPPLRLINLDDMSGQGGPGRVGGELSKIDVPQGGTVISGLAVAVDAADGSDWIFINDDGGVSGIHVDVAGDGTPSLSVGWNVAYGSFSSPVVANGIVFYLSGGGIRALDAHTGQELWIDRSAGGVHWESPIVVNGNVYITDESGQVSRFGL